MSLTDQQALAILATGETVIDVACGKSMEPRIMDGQRITIEPFQHDRKLNIGDMVFVAINGKFLHHQIIGFTSDGRYIIGNIHRKVDGIVTVDKIYGIVNVAPERCLD